MCRTATSTSLISLSPSVVAPPDRPCPRKSKADDPAMQVEPVGDAPDVGPLPVQGEPVRDARNPGRGRRPGARPRSARHHRSPGSLPSPRASSCPYSAGRFSRPDREAFPGRSRLRQAGALPGMPACRSGDDHGSARPARRRHPVRRDRGRRSDRQAGVHDPGDPAAAALRQHRSRSRCARSAAMTSAGLPGTGTTSAPASTPARTSTRQCTGSAAATARTSPQCRCASLIAPAVVLDFSEEAAADPDFLLEPDHIRQWESQHGPLPDGGWLLYRTGWDARSAQPAGRSSTPTRPGRIRRASPSSARGGSPRRRRSSASASRPSAPTPGTAHSFDPPFPCHSALLGAGQVRAHAAAEPRCAAADRARSCSPGRCRSSAGRAARPGCWPWSSGPDARHRRRRQGAHGPGRRHGVRRRRQRQLPRHQCADRARRPVRRRAA